MSGIVKIEVITGMSKLTDLIQNLSKCCFFSEFHICLLNHKILLYL